MTQWLSTYGPRLLSGGFPIVPIRPLTKHPGIKGWQQIKADEATLRYWLSHGFKEGGVGILTRTIPAVDLDVLDTDIVTDLVNWCTTHIGSTVVRVGQAPKHLLVYRTETPFPKQASPRYVDFLGVEHKVEILGDGQQFVAFATHPGTGQPYRWVSDRTLADISVADLSVMTQDHADALLAYFDTIIPPDWEAAGKESGGLLFSDRGALPVSDTSHTPSDLRPQSREGYGNTSHQTAGHTLPGTQNKSTISCFKLKQALSCLDPDMRMHDWVRVGMALYHQYDGNETGFALWDTWSARGQKYEPQTMRSRWRSFKADGAQANPVTAATILHLAKNMRTSQKKHTPQTHTTQDTAQNTARDTTRDAGQEHVGLVPPNDAGHATPLADFLTRYVLIEHGNLVCDLKKPPHCAVSRLEEFRNATANIRHGDLRLDPSGSRVSHGSAPTHDRTPIRSAVRTAQKLKPVHQCWLVHKDRKTAQGVRYDPARPFFYQDPQDHLWWVNEFHMQTFAPPINGDTRLFYDHMDYLFPRESERRWFMDWMAFNIQYPARRCKVTPLHISLAHGTGRGWLVELMAALLGRWNCTKTRMATLCGDAPQFTEFLDKSLFCAVEEVREGTRRYAVSDKTRDLLTENDLEVNVKHGSKRTQPVFTNFFFMSNHPDALVLTEEDRRINVFSGPKAARDRSYYLALYAWLETNGVAALFYDLKARDLSDFNWQHATDTPARTRMIHNNRSETEALFHQIRTAPPYPAMLFAQIVREMISISETTQTQVQIDEGQLTKLLQHHTQHGSRMMFGGRQGKVGRPWIFDPSIQHDTQAIRHAVENCGL